ncbi:MAG: CDF family Co(II)/Ni(II) efflux transporter DmeF [Thermodesulfobacteriota bacterium]
MDAQDRFNRRHDHHYPGTGQRSNERRTLLVVGLTGAMMVIEVVSGILFGSMALLADGWHMASHGSALGLTAAAYYLARRHAADPRFSFGTGKVGDLAAFASAFLLGLIALFMAWESARRLVRPVEISFDEAIVVAVIGLAVNVLSALILKDPRREHEEDHHHRHRDHNLRAAYLHVLADALTSVLAVAALTAGRFRGWNFLDPVMGLVGAAVITRWSYGLMRDSGRVLLDMNVNRELVERVRREMETRPETNVTDLHVWRIGPGHFAVLMSVTTPDPRPPAYYKELLGRIPEISHLSVEVNPGP